MFTKEDLEKAFNAARKHTYVQDYVGDDMFTKTTTVRKDTYTTFEQYFNEIVQRERLNEETTCKCKIPTTDWNPFDIEDKSENHTHCTVCKGKLPSRCDSPN